MKKITGSVKAIRRQVNDVIMNKYATQHYTVCQTILLMLNTHIKQLLEDKETVRDINLHQDEIHQFIF